jgi:ABC-type bacteriocin/lantibiotic exporter with double-glycine peptidase domain
MVYLPQFVRLFNASILENLRIFSGGAPFGQLMTAAELTGLSQLVGDLPMGFDTLLAQGGENFSGGQRQLIAITAVLASAKPVLLLDEALANLDSLRQAGLVHSPLFKSKTILYTSHDAQRFGRADSRRHKG